MSEFVKCYSCGNVTAEGLGGLCRACAPEEPDEGPDEKLPEGVPVDQVGSDGGMDYGTPEEWDEAEDSGEPIPGSYVLSMRRVSLFPVSEIEYPEETEGLGAALVLS
jgi:NMD protein affecting ribosome stability and mRNA decay